MRYFLLVVLAFSFNKAYAACSAAPVGTPNDPLLQLRLNGDGKAALGPANYFDATEEGAVVWDDSNNTLAFCNGSEWITIGESLPSCNTDEYAIKTASGWDCHTGMPPGGTDSTPNAFTISNVTDAEPGSAILSNIVQITGVDTQATVTISGDGTPEFRICADVGCGSVLTDWRSGFDTIEFGRYLQLRATSPTHSNTGTANYSVGTTNASWDITSRHRYVFVSQDSWTSDSLGGVSGSDSKCNSQAAGASLPGAYKAWLATSSYTPASTFTKSTSPYYMPNGTKIADNWSDLTDGTINAKINRDQFGNYIGSTNAKAWTNVSTTGQATDTASTRHCVGWNTSSTSSTYRGWMGSTNFTDSDWTKSNTSLCNGGGYDNHLYCFEQ